MLRPHTVVYKEQWPNIVSNTIAVVLLHNDVYTVYYYYYTVYIIILYSVYFYYTVYIVYSQLSTMRTTHTHACLNLWAFILSLVLSLSYAPWFYAIGTRLIPLLCHIIWNMVFGRISLRSKRDGCVCFCFCFVISL